MTQDDKEFLKEFFTGGIFIVTVIGVVLLVLARSGIFPKEPSSSNFKVVDTYKGCDVVRYTNSQFAEYKYFLHCNNTRPVYEK